MKRISFILIIFVCVGCFIGCNAGVRKKVENKRNHIKKLIHVGMNLDEAIGILKTNGYIVGPKHLPSQKRDYISVNIPLVDKIPVSETYAEVIGTESSLNIYVILKAGLDKKIKSIE